MTDWVRVVVIVVCEIMIIVGALMIHAGFGLMVGGLIAWWEVAS